MDKKLRIFATCDIGEALDLLRNRGYEVEVYPQSEAPSKSLIIDKVKSGIDGLITTLRDPIDAQVFEAGKSTLKVVAQIAVGFDNINRADANRFKIPFTHTADVLTEATAEFAFLCWGFWPVRCGPPNTSREITSGDIGILTCPFSGMRSQARRSRSSARDVLGWR